MNADVLAALPELSWAGLPPIPSDVKGYEWSHALAERRYPYVDGAGHDHTGRDPITVTADLFFHSTVDEAAIPSKWEGWREALLSGADHELVHPLLGQFRARVQRVQGDLSAMIRSGTTLTVTWVETIDDPTVATVFQAVEITLGASAAAAQRATDALGIEWPDGAPDTTISGAIAQVEGAIASVELTVGGVANQVMGAIDSMIGVAEKLTDPAAWVAVELLQGLWLQVDAAVRTARLSARPTATATIERDTTLDAFAAARGNTLEEIQGLNIFALRSPSVPRGTTLTYYSA